MLKRTQNLIATLTAVVALLVASAGTFGSALFGGAIFDGINSAFNHGFPNFYGGGGATHDTTMSVNTNSIGQLHQTFEAEKWGTYRLDPAIAATSLLKSEGWFVEARVNAISAPNPFPSSFQASSAVMLTVDDYEEDMGVIVSFEENAVSVVDDNFQILLQQAHDGGFHTTRIVRAPNSPTVDFIFDGQLVGSAAVGSLDGEAGRMGFGDGYGASEALWDHVVVNHEVQDTHTRFYEEDNPPAGRAVDVIAKDNFEGHNTGDLVGQTAPTGQTYIVDQALVDSIASTSLAPVQSMSVENTSGKPNGPGQGVGHSPYAGTPRFDAALLPVGELAPGTYRLEFDAYHPGSGSGDPHFSLIDTDGGNKVIVAWEPGNGKIHFEGIGYPSPSFEIGGNPVGLHLALDVDTINNTSQAIWEDLDGLHIFGETPLQSIPFNFAPDTIGMLINFDGVTDLPPGFDNLRLSKLRMVPEPATVTLLGLAGMGLLRRRRAA